MNIRNEIKDLVLDTESDGSDSKGSKSISLRLPYEDYAKLRVLSNRLNMRPTSLAKKIFISGLSEATSGYFDAMDDETVVADFAESVQEITIDLVSED